MEKYWHTEKGFVNPEGNITTRGPRIATVRWLLTRTFFRPYQLGIDVPEDHVLSRDEALSLLWKHSGAPSLTWLGHATFLFRLNGVNILTDPFLFGNPGPAFIRGLKRIPSPLQGDDFDVDTLLISHEHHDHVHHPSLASLKNKAGIHAVVPLGVGKKLQKHSFGKTTELDWFQKVHINNSVSITALPAVHYSNFSNSSLWAGFVMSFADDSGKEKKIYFAGDTDYGSFVKKEIAQYGPFDIACVGTGGFYLPFPSRAEIVHTNPEEAVRVAAETGAKKMIGMHWGTVRLSDENPAEVLPRMQAHAKKIGYAGELAMLRIGETILI